MIRRFLGRTAITTAATALLLSTLSGTANAAVGTVNVAQVFTNDSIPVCVQDPITVRSGIIFVTASNGVYLIPIGSSDIDIDLPPGL
jgi:hypothetical protein